MRFTRDRTQHQMPMIDSICLQVICCSLVLTVGCAPTLHESLSHRTLAAPLNSPSPIHVDVEASELRWEEPILLNFQPSQLRRDLATLIQGTLNGPTQRAERVGDTAPTRFLLEVHRLHYNFNQFFFPCLIYFTFFGCPVETIRADITFTLEHQGERFRASTSGEATFNYFQHSFGQHPPEIRVVGIAIAKALKLIAQSAVAPPKTLRGKTR